VGKGGNGRDKAVFWGRPAGFLAVRRAGAGQGQTSLKWRKKRFTGRMGSLILEQGQNRHGSVQINRPTGPESAGQGAEVRLHGG